MIKENAGSHRQDETLPSSRKGFNQVFKMDNQEINTRLIPTPAILEVMNYES